jgi:putative Mg2+ transporter-C (MgtC) family protein
VNELFSSFGPGSSGTGDFWEIVVKVLLSALLGGAVGAERERTGKWAGLRTHMLIAVGAALVTDVSVSIGYHYGPNQGWDPGRVAAQIVSGLGFIGAGTIIQSRGAVHGLTTAASLWVAGAIGLAVGAGFYDEAAVTTVALLLILAALRPLSRRLSGDAQSLALRLSDPARLPELIELLGREAVELETVKLDEHASDGAGRSVLVKVRASDEEREALAKKLAELDWVEPEGGK